MHFGGILWVFVGFCGFLLDFEDFFCLFLVGPADFFSFLSHFVGFCGIL